jgi:hypothetical protein
MAGNQGRSRPGLVTSAPGSSPTSGTHSPDEAPSHRHRAADADGRALQVEFDVRELHTSGSQLKMSRASSQEPSSAERARIGRGSG